FQYGRMIFEQVADHEDTAGLHGLFLQEKSLPVVNGQRLFYKYILAAVQSFRDQREVCFRGRGDDHSVNFGAVQYVREAVVNGDARGQFQSAFPALLGGIAYGGKTSQLVE